MQVQNMKNPQPLREGKLYVRVINSQHDIQSSSSSSSWIWSVLICGAGGGGGHSMRRKLRCEMYSYGTSCCFYYIFFVLLYA